VTAHPFRRNQTGGFKLKQTKKVQIRNLLIMIILLTLLWSLAFIFAPNGEALEDPMLENAIRIELGLTSDVPLEPSELDTITSLSARESGITSIRGISQMPNLTELDLRGNEIEELEPLSRLDNLVTLDLRENQIRSIDTLDSLTSLEDLNLRENQLTDISPLSSLVNMRELNIRDNQISDIDALAELEVLQDLNIRNNQISSIEPLANLEDLVQRLYLEGNPIIDTSVVDHYYESILEKDF